MEEKSFSNFGNLSEAKRMMIPRNRGENGFRKQDANETVEKQHQQLAEVDNESYIRK